MKKYFVIDMKDGDTWGDNIPFDTFEEAKEEGDMQWSHLTKREQKGRTSFQIVVGEFNEEEHCIDYSADYEVVYDYQETI